MDKQIIMCHIVDHYSAMQKNELNNMTNLKNVILVKEALHKRVYTV